jgi:O-antigen/teichoic acid export membrane protein
MTEETRRGTTVAEEARPKAASNAPATAVQDPSAPVHGDDRPGGSLRRLAARGTLINSGFQIGLYGAATLERFGVAAWLTRSEYGMWGVLMSALLALTWIKNWGIGDKYIQQSEADQEKAFQKAFTLELGLSLIFFATAVVAMPIYAVAYGRPQMIVPGIVLAVAMPITAFEAPAWIPYRRMQYGRQRLLTSVDPVVTIACSLTLVASGLGYWGLVIGGVAGSVAGGLACSLTSPYRLRLRYERGTIRDYASFSWPLMGFTLCGVVILQGTMLISNRVVGLAGIGAIGLAIQIAGMADGVDSIVSQAIYPAACAAADRIRVLSDAFVKSNRVALMWAMPATVGVALFAGDVVPFVLGDRWRPAVGLIAAVAVTCGVGQVGFNWAVFLRAVNRTRPIFTARAIEVLVFLFVSAPLILAFGLAGFAGGFAARILSQVAARAYYMRQIFGGYSAIRQLLRGFAPIVVPTAAILLLRVAAGGHRGAARVVGEVVLYSALAVIATLLLERALVSEMLGYLRRVKPRGETSSIALDAEAQPSGL